MSEILTKPILVINKVDRLITELRLSPTEAYYHLLRLVEHVTSLMGSLFFTERAEQGLQWSDMANTAKIITYLELMIKPQHLKSKYSSNLFIAICPEWLPISTTTFRAIFAKVPDPIIAQSTRLPKILYTDSLDSIQAITHNDLERDLYAGRVDESSYLVAYVTQMFAIPTNEFPQFQVPSNEDHHSSISTSLNPLINESSIHKKNNSNQNASQYLKIL
ncbi:hypothetical protein O181_122938 [Austropuccinia psidii MF-1]|uniref:Uncharacterized protein n=1 Tax=Austropuccinia psidii MF-1 TaxID=1389203 RepID=A0A9Q3KKT4_9BASI|nr:hypothetical protein [Austropuccinia psidii MF-1]